MISCFEWVYTIFGLNLEIIFSTEVEDFDGNKTGLEQKAILTPLFEEEINKSTWSLITSQSVNGNAWEGATVNFWDDVIDTTGNNSDNSYFMIWRDQNGGSLKMECHSTLKVTQNWMSLIVECHLKWNVI